MIIIKVQGGLGNQMFQYALYKRLKQDGRDVKLDLTSYVTYKLHNGFELERIFDIKVNCASKEEIFQLIINGYINEFKINKGNNFIRKVVESDDKYLSGYWQIEKYFKSIRNILIKDYRIIIDDKENTAVLREIQNSESVCIHVRRGDYLSEENLNGFATLEYYKEAISIIKDKVKEPKFFVFSDDMEWVKENLNVENSVIVNFNSGIDSYKDMFLMSQCKHNIIANSTFSWWGAWLNTNEDKIVIRPARWSKNSKIGDDLCSCNNWIECNTIAEIYNGGKNIQQVDDVKYETYKDEEIFYFLSNMFEGKEFMFIKSLKNYKHKYIYYFNFRIAIVENDNDEVKDNFKKFVENIDKYKDLDKHISSMFHLAKYRYDRGEFEEAKLFFEKVDDITQGKHKSAKEYLLRLNS